VITAGLGLVIILFLAAAARTIFQTPDPAANRFLLPFYDPSTFSWKAVSTGTSIAMLTYIGFDGISTLSEEARDPRRNILLATVLTCLVTGILAATQVYAAQLVWPHYEGFPDVDTAFVYIAGKAGGPALFSIVNLALLLATIGSGAGSHLAAGRLLYGMGRDNAIPARFFSALDPKTQIPRNNILLVGVLALAGALALSYQLGAELLNFGAFIGFMGVNLAAFVRYYLRAPRRTFLNLVPPLLGFAICLYIWWSLRPVAKMAGLAWLAVGLLYGAWKTRGFRHQIKAAPPDEL
jgi:amino acid transporter